MSLCWFSSYLTIDKNFSVSIGWASFTSAPHFTCGAPQGSIWGPLYFLYICILPWGFNIKFHLYADDIPLYISPPGDTVNVTQILLWHDTSTRSDMFCCWSLTWSSMISSKLICITDLVSVCVLICNCAISSAIKFCFSTSLCQSQLPLSSNSQSDCEAAMCTLKV